MTGVEDAEDRKKLFFLIQRLQTVSLDQLLILPAIMMFYMRW
jgi:hypothetical protein